MCKPALRSGRFLLLASLLLSAEPVTAQTAPRHPTPITLTNAAYAAALRGTDGHVDGEAMAARITELGVKTYYWLIWRDTDWDDLKAFLPKAAAAGIEVWPYLVPPSESPPNTPCYSEPFRLDYKQWAEEIARLSLEHPNLTAWVIDDFYANKDLFTPEYVRGMQEHAGKVNPKLAFLPLMYFGEIDRAFAEAYGPVVDGVVAAYPRDRAEIEAAQDVEFRLRHGDPVTPERVAERLRMCLQCQQDGLCEAVVTYCLDLDPAGAHFGPAKNLFQKHTN